MNKHVSIVALTSLMAVTAHAAGNVPATDPRGDEIIVTATKRETRLQDTAISITAIDEQGLKNANIDGLNDLAKAVPGLVVTDAGAGQRTISLRGIRSAGEAQVGVYYDEAPLSAPPGINGNQNSGQSDFKLFDVERIEVLRGPQGTLYGASSMGGAIRLVLNKPDLNEFQARIEGSATTTDGTLGHQLNAAFNVPIVRDTLAARAVLFRRHSEGWVDNPRLDQEGINGEDTIGGRLLLRYVPFESLVVDLGAHYQDIEAASGGWSPSLGKYNAPHHAVLPFKDEQALYNATANLDLGTVALVLTTSFQDRDQLVTRDPTALLQRLAPEVAPGTYYQPQSVQDWTSELRLQSTGSGPWTWTVGSFFQDREAEVLSEGHRVDPATGVAGSPPDIFLQRHIGDELRQTAFFVETAYDFTSRFTLTGGLRHYDYKKTVSGDTTIGFAPLGTVVTPWSSSTTTNDGWLYKLNGAFKLADDVLLYAQVATGYRPGGVNQVIGEVASVPYLPDELVTYEVGVKSSFLDRRFLFNVTAYRNDWTDMQVSLNNGRFVYLGNAGAARVDGIEAELVALPAPGVTLSANFSFLDPRLTKDQVADGTTAAGASGRAGDRIPGIAKFSGTIAGEYEWQLRGDLTGYFRADANHVGGSITGFREGPTAYEIGDYTLANSRLGVRSNRWGAYLFGNNLFDVTARVSAGGTLGGTTEVITTVPPRTIGVGLSLEF